MLWATDWGDTFEGRQPLYKSLPPMNRVINWYLPTCGRNIFTLRTFAPVIGRWFEYVISHKKGATTAAPSMEIIMKLINLKWQHPSSLHEPHKIEFVKRKHNNNNNTWFLQRKGIKPLQIPVTSWPAGSTLIVDSPWAQVFFTKVVDEELPVIFLDTFFHVAQFL